MKKQRNKKKLKKIGWKEVLDLPEFGIFGIMAKVDTGARTSVLHCSKIELVKKFRKNYVRFVPLAYDDGQSNINEFTLPFHHERKIKNSFGVEENRYVIKTSFKIFGKSYEAELSLRDRSNLEFPMLLGRTAIHRRFIVDVAKSNQGLKYLNKKQARIIEK